MRFWTGLALGCAFAALASPASAQSARPGGGGSTREDCAQRYNHDLAIRACSDLLRRSPRDGWAYGNRGDAYRMKSMYDIAIADLSAAIKINPRDAFSYGSRGESYRMKGQLDLAISDFDQAIMLNTRDHFSY